MKAQHINLRAVEPEDVDFIFECEADRQAARWSDYRAPFSKNQLLTYALTYDADPFSARQLRLIAEEQSGEKIGIVDFFEITEKDSKASLGILIHSSHRNEGYGEKTLLSAIEFAKSRLGLRKIVAEIAECNDKALKLFLKEGFRKLALLPSWHKIEGEFIDFVLLDYTFRP